MNQEDGECYSLKVLHTYLIAASALRVPNFAPFRSMQAEPRVPDEVFFFFFAFSIRNNGEFRQKSFKIGNLQFQLFPM